MNTIILKQISILSIFLGAALGIITLIPFIGSLAFWILMCLSSTAVILFMMKMELLAINTVRESAVLGAIIGFVSFVGFSITYIPLMILINLIFHISSNSFVAATLGQAGFGLIFLLVIFMGVLCATVNAFSGFVTYFGIDFYNTLKQNDNNTTEKFKLK